MNALSIASPDQIYCNHLPSCRNSRNLSTELRLSRRTDNRRINSSPVSATFPVIRVQSGCPQDIRIPMEDPDGDVVQCSWARGTSNCGDFCEAFPFASLDKVKTKKQFNFSSNSDLTTSGQEGCYLHHLRRALHDKQIWRIVWLSQIVKFIFFIRKRSKIHKQIPGIFCVTLFQGVGS